MPQQTIDFYASHVHFVDHLAPIWFALDPRYRGVFLAGAGLAADIAKLDYGIDAQHPKKTGTTRSVVVASYGDYRRIGAADVVFVEHGAGQTYGNNHPGSPGGPNRNDGIRLYITPNYDVAAKNTATYPGVPNVIAGVPKLDPWHLRDKSRDDPPTVAVSFSWDRPHAPESKGAYRHFRKYLHRVAREFPGALAHAHPRIFHRFYADFRRFGFEPVPRFTEILDRADVYVCDNSSTIFEFASTGRPVVLLNAPWYRRHVEHGLRFWEHAGIGVNVDHGRDLIDGIHLALEDPPEVAEDRHRHVTAVYPLTDGHASRRAAEGIMALINSGTLRGKCPVCGANHSTCARTLEDGTPVETFRELEATMQSGPANYRVTRLINGHEAEIAVTADELTDEEKRMFGLKAAGPARNKARRPERNKASAVETLEAPSKSDNKPAWEAYANALGVDITDDEGNTITKDAIIDRVDEATTDGE